MNTIDGRQLPEFPPPVGAVLDEFIGAARDAFGSDLRSAILFGSAAEGRLRATSDVNLILVLAAFDPSRADQLRRPLRVAQAAIRLSVMFLLESELDAATSAFAEKFADILRRRQVLYGTDPFSSVSIPRNLLIERVNQVLLNLTLRLRETYVARGLREEQLALAAAAAAGPLRSCAATLLELEGKAFAAPKEALESIAEESKNALWSDALRRLSEARREGLLPAGSADPGLMALIDIARHVRTRLLAIKESTC